MPWDLLEKKYAVDYNQDLGHAEYSTFCELQSKRDTVWMLTESIANSTKLTYSGSKTFPQFSH